MYFVWLVGTNQPTPLFLERICMSLHGPQLASSIMVSEENNRVTVKGFNTGYFEREVRRYWGSPPVGNYFLDKNSFYKVTFDSFFVPDLVYVLEKIVKQGRESLNRVMMSAALEGLKTKTWYAGVNHTYPSRLRMGNLKNIKKKLLTHQLEFLKRYDSFTQSYRLKGYLLAAEPGTGKTIASIALSEVLQTNVTIVIAPSNSIERVWKETLTTELNTKPKVWTTADREQTPIAGCRYYVFHYEALERALALAKTIAHLNVNIIIDECHNFNDVGSLRTQRLIELCKTLKCSNVLWMSGTPVKALGKEVIPLLKTIDPFFTEEVEEQFKKTFGLSTTRAIDILSARLGFVTFKVSNDFVKNIVTSIDVRVKLENGHEYTLEALKEKMVAFIKERITYYQKEMPRYTKLYNDCLSVHVTTLKSPSQKTQYAIYRQHSRKLHTGVDMATDRELILFCNKYEKDVIIPTLPNDLKTIFRDAKSVYKYYPLKVQGEALGRILGRERMRCNLDISTKMQNAVITDPDDPKTKYTVTLEDIVDSAIAKTVIFTDYVEVVNAVSESFKSQGYIPLRVLAETNKDLANIIHTFEVTNANPLIATYKSLSTAVPLTMADVVVFLNMPFRSFEYEQALARLDRIGQKNPIKAYHIFLDTGDIPNISTRSKDILEWSKEMVAKIMGSPTENIELALDMQSFVPGYYSNNSISTWAKW